MALERSKAGYSLFHHFMEPRIMHDDLIAGAEAAADYTGLSRRHIYRLADGGLIPTVRKGRRLYFRKSELELAFQGAGQLL